MEVINEDYYFFLFHEICILVCRCSIKAETITKEKKSLSYDKRERTIWVSAKHRLADFKIFLYQYIFFSAKPIEWSRRKLCTRMTKKKKKKKAKFDSKQTPHGIESHLHQRFSSSPPGQNNLRLETASRH